MEQQEIIKGNIKIADFLGWKIDNSFPDKGRVWRKGNVIELDSTFKFHLSWDALMEVINKIILIEKEFLYSWFIWNDVNNLENAWNAVVKTIDKYNLK